MINTILKIFVIFLIVILQFTLMPLLAIKGVWPNLILTSLLILSLLEHSEDAFLFACVAGFLQDLAGPLKFGINILFYLSIIYSVQYLIKKYISEINLLVIVVIVIIFTLIYGFFISLIVHLPLNQSLIYESIYNAISAIGLFFIFRLVYQNKLLITVDKI